MSDQRRSRSFSVVQVGVAWLAGLFLSGGLLGLIAFHPKPWAFGFVVALIAGGIATASGVITYAVNHWDDHD